MLDLPNHLASQQPSGRPKSARDFLEGTRPCVTALYANAQSATSGGKYFLLTVGRAAMLTEMAGRVLPFTREQLFDVVADIERYPDFMPGWISASISRREGNSCDVEQILGLGPVRLPFASRAVLQRPARLDITSSDAAFRQFSLCVLISPGTSAAECHFSVSAQVELRSLFLQAILGRFLANSITDISAAFEARAHRLYDAQAR